MKFYLYISSSSPDEMINNDEMIMREISYVLSNLIITQHQENKSKNKIERKAYKCLREKNTLTHNHILFSELFSILNIKYWVCPGKIFQLLLICNSITHSWTNNKMEHLLCYDLRLLQFYDDDENLLRLKEKN
jgi:hypothetical protein